MGALLAAPLWGLFGCGGGGGGGGRSGKAPRLDALAPTTARPGESVTLIGDGLSADMIVDFGGHRVAVIGMSGEHTAFAIVPAVSPGSIEVAVEVARQRSNPLPLTIAAALGVALPDTCADAMVVTQVPCTAQLDVRAAAREPSDPLLDCMQPGNTPRRGDRSVWFAWNETAARDLVVDTFGSGYHTVIAAYEGDCGSLRSIACNDDAAGGPQSEVRFSTQPGGRYLIEIVAWTPPTDDPAPGGDLTVTFREATQGVTYGDGDRCDAPRPITALPFREQLDTSTKTRAPDDPPIDCILAPATPRRGDRSVWWRYRAPRPQQITISTRGSSYDTVLAVYAGACGGLLALACNDDAFGGKHSEATLGLGAGQTVLIEVVHWTDANDTPSAGGTLVLEVTESGSNALGNDPSLFADLIVTDLFDPTVFGSGASATLALASHITNIGTVPAPGGAQAGGSATFRLRRRGEQAVIVEGRKGPVFFTNSGGCDPRLHDAWLLEGSPLLAGTGGAPTYTDPGCTDLYTAATNNRLDVPLTIGTLPDGEYELECEVDELGVYVVEPPECKANNRGTVPIRLGTAPSGARTVTVTGPIEQSGLESISDTGLAATLIGNGAPQAVTLSAGDRFDNTLSAIGRPWAVRFDRAGTLYYTLRDAGALCRDNGDGTSSVVVAGLSGPCGFDWLPGGDVVVAEREGNRVSVAARLPAGGFAAPIPLAVTASVTWRGPSDVIVDPAGAIYVANTDAHEVWRVDRTSGSAQRVAGTGIQGFSGDGQPAHLAQLAYPAALALDAAAGVLVIADSHNNRLRAVSLGGSQPVRFLGFSIDPGEIITIAGRGPGSVSTVFEDNGAGGFFGDGQHGRAVRMDRPLGVALVAGRLFYTDADNHRVRMIDAFGYSHTVAGAAALPGANGDRHAGSSLGLGLGDGGPGTQADFNRPSGLAVRDSAPGRYEVIVADSDWFRVRAIDGVTVR